jgi:hypothetical protein
MPTADISACDHRCADFGVLPINEETADVHKLTGV